MNKRYTNGEITVFWKPRECAHSGNCFRSLSAVFNPQQRPWITMGGATTKEIIAAVQGCPSGALSYKKLREERP